ncbi:hypothetical protein SynMVIR181_00722 [Synechococcus sp. MVIR-18-1]|nr:hypothetical protein SynMVIR181_00722 [Synechococcus sp. MVIR-18-1]
MKWVRVQARIRHAGFVARTAESHARINHLICRQHKFI